MCIKDSCSQNGRRVEFKADVDGDGGKDMRMGDNVVPSGAQANCRVTLVGGPLELLPYTVTVIKDGFELTSLTIGPGATSAEFVDTPAFGVRSYYRVEVTGQQALFPEVPAAAALSGNMIGLSNPIYFNFDPAL